MPKSSGDISVAAGPTGGVQVGAAIRRVRCRELGRLVYMYRKAFLFCLISISCVMMVRARRLYVFRVRDYVCRTEGGGAVDAGKSLLAVFTPLSDDVQKKYPGICMTMYTVLVYHMHAFRSRFGLGQKLRSAES